MILSLKRVVWFGLVLGLVWVPAGLMGEADGPQAAMDKDLLEVTIPRLEGYYTSHRYTVRQVVEWHLARIRKYNPIYRAVQTLTACHSRFNTKTCWLSAELIRTPSTYAGKLSKAGAQVNSCRVTFT